ncbi:MAG: peptidylprolyl isomerase [Paracoccaceae bacterium]
MKKLLMPAYLSFIITFLPSNVISQDANTILATVGETKITLGHVIALQSRLTTQYKNLDDSTLFNGILDQLIQQAVVAENVKKQNFSEIKYEYENQIRTYLANLYIEKITLRKLSETRIKEFYESQYKISAADKEFNASHILLETEPEASEVQSMLKANKDFSELAKTRSTGPSGPSGGNLGWFSKGMMVPPFEKAVLGLKVGEISDPIQTQFGWHIIKLIDVREKAIPSLEEVRPKIEQSLRQKDVKTEIQNLTSKTEVIRSEISINPSIIRNIELISK